MSYGKPFKLTVTAPPEVRFECYLLPYGKRITQRIVPEKNNVFTIGCGYDHMAWGNVLMFKALPGAPRKFDISLLFTAPDGKELHKAAIPVEILPEQPKESLAATPVLRSWYGYPIERANWREKPENLQGELFRYWNDCGFSGARNAIDGAPHWSSYFDYTHVLSHLRNDAPTLPLVTTAGGTPGEELICPSALIRGGKEFFVNEMKRKNRVEAISKGAPRVVSDYEPYAGRNGYVTGHCFCAECRSAFARTNRLDQVPDVRSILTNHEKEWVAFRLTQRAMVIKAMADAVRSVNPKAQFALCSMPSPGREEAERYYKEYGIDLKQHDPHVDVHMMMNYSPSIDFFKRLEQDALTLKKPLSPILDNGWGTASGYYAERSHLQLLAAAFCGVPEVYFGRGLMLMDGKMLRRLREALVLAKRHEKLFSAGKLAEKSPFLLDFGKEAQSGIHVFQRALPGGAWLLLAVNNHPSTTWFGAIKGKASGSWQELTSNTTLSPDGRKRTVSAADLSQGLPVKLTAFGKLLLLYRPDGKSDCAKLADATVTAREARDEQQRIAAMSRPQKQYGMSTRMLPGGFEIATPVQQFLVRLGVSASGEWRVNDRNVADAVGLDGMVSPVVQMFREAPADFVASKIFPDRVEAEFVTRLKDYTYDGLAIHKKYTVWRDKPEIDVAVSVVPEKGYRFFRYRVTNIIGMGKDRVSLPYPPHVGYRIAQGSTMKDDRNGDNRVYHRKNVKPFFAKEGPADWFDGSHLEACNTSTGEKIHISFDDAEELFFWRRGNTATAEWICRDAYPDRDPHKVKVWKTNYKLRYSSR